MDHERSHRPLADRIQALKKTLQAPEKAACEACLSRLDGYVSAQLAGRDYQAEYPEVAAHLDACLECAQSYARLYELELAVSARADPLPRVGRVPAPDLRFLRQTAAGSPGPDALARQLRAALRRAGDWLTFSLSPDLMTLLQPAPALSGLRAGAGERYGELLLQLEPEDLLQPEIPFRLAVYRDARQPDLALVEITLAPPGRAWPDLAGIEVQLQWDSQTRPAASDAWGVAAFEGIPLTALPSLVVQVHI